MHVASLLIHMLLNNEDRKIKNSVSKIHIAQKRKNP